VLGPGSGARNPHFNDLAVPWLAALQLGYRIGLVLETLRLSIRDLSPWPCATLADEHDTNWSSDAGGSPWQTKRYGHGS
jgi:hypothetical protein